MPSFALYFRLKQFYNRSKCLTSSDVAYPKKPLNFSFGGLQGQIGVSGPSKGFKPTAF
jgi:hypothetical protein